MPLPPSPPTELPYGTTLVAGCGFSTVIADMDFETYSEAGMIFDVVEQKWVSPHGTAKKGLPLVGMRVYAEHPSTEVLCLAYDLKDGKGRRLWTPNHPLPLDLFAHLRDGKLVEAFNSAFESYIWEFVCRKKYGFPPLPSGQVRCAAAKARAFCLPPSLGEVAKAVKSEEMKDTAGTALLNFFSVPRKPTKKNPRLRNLPVDNLGKAKDLYNYCLQDIKTEAAVSQICPDLIPSELAFWQADQECNAEGIRIDREAVLAAIKLLEGQYESAGQELSELTGGAVQQVTEVAKLISWLHSQGVYTDVLDEEALDELLEREGLPDLVKQVLRIRSELGGAAVRKLIAMRNQWTREGRVHDNFLYHGARTGRDTGKGIQCQNMPNSGPDVAKCEHCGKFSDPAILKSQCPACGVSGGTVEVEEWNDTAAEEAIEALKNGTLQYFYKRPSSALQGCIRGMLIADEGCDFIGSDYSAIEAVVAACLAGEEWRLEVFRNKGDIYLESVSRITKTPIDVYKQYAKDHGKKHPHRKVGKVAELACFSRHTEVLTDRGYVRIVDVKSTDKLWDGVAWNEHGGVILKGKRKVINLDGVRVTPEHPVSTKDSWREAKELASNANMLSQALDFGSENLPLFQSPENKQEGLSALRSRAHVVENLTSLTSITSLGGPRPGATIAQRNQRLRRLKRITGRIKILLKTTTTGADFLIGFQLRGDGVKTPKIKCTKTTAVEEYQYQKSGRVGFVEKTENAVSLNTSSRFLDGMIHLLKWIGRTLTKDMSPGTFGLSAAGKTHLIKGLFQICKERLTRCENVYDILNAGPRNRFTIKTDSGHLIVHNSGYGGWIGAWVNFGADKLMSEDEIKANILAWRAASPAIVEAWGGQTDGMPWDGAPKLYGLEGAFIQAVHYPNTFVPWRNGVGYIKKGNHVYCFLPSGRHITYHNVLLTPHRKWEGLYAISFEGYNTNPKMGPRGWVRLETYGGRLFENVVQAVSRDIMTHAAVQAHTRGYRLRLRVHDELVTSVPEGWGSIEEFEGIMNTLPEWAAGWPVRSAGGWRGKRFRK